MQADNIKLRCKIKEVENVSQKKKKNRKNKTHFGALDGSIK
jgi:hypothetical protein